MKAYVVKDRKGCGCNTIIFAETAGKAKSYALEREEFENFDFTDICAIRCKKLDSLYRGEREYKFIKITEEEREAWER